MYIHNVASLFHHHLEVASTFCIIFEEGQVGVLPDEGH